MPTPEQNSDDKVDDEKFKIQLKAIEENYESHLDEILPDYLHRGDIFSNSRMLGYIDAMMATCATFLVIPLRNLKELKENQSLADFSSDHQTEFIMFFIGFLVVLTLWESINIRAFFIKRMDDFLVLFLIIQLLAATGLPFSLALQGHYQHEETPIIITCSLLALFEIMEIIMTVYAMATPRTLHLALHKYEKSDRGKFRNMMIIKNVVNLFVIGIGGVLCLSHYAASWVFMAFLIANPLLRKLIFYMRRRFARKTKMDKCQFYFMFTKGNVPKERVEAMSDAAIAIIACILILDITVEEFPSREKVEHKGLNHELDHMKTEFFAFLLTYATVSFLWYINHSMLHLFKTVNVVLLFGQKVFLAFACLTPLVSNMITKFVNADSPDTNFSIRAGSMNVFFSSLANFLMLAYGMYTREKYLHQWAISSCIKVNMRQHIYVLLKALTMPFWSLLCALGTLGSAEVARVFLFVCLGGNILTFIVLKFAFLNHFGREVYTEKTDPRAKAFLEAEEKKAQVNNTIDEYDSEEEELKREKQLADAPDINDNEGENTAL